MLTFVESDQSYLPSITRNQIIKVVSSALKSITTNDGKFIVNDSSFFRTTNTGKINPCVVNSAAFISSKFQSYLDNLPFGQGETSLHGQNIDGYLEFEYTGHGISIADKDNLLKVIHGYIKDNNLPNESVYTLFPAFYGMFVERSTFGIDDIPERFHKYFNTSKIKTVYRIGVEFETGNIASSFRALNKLAGLFQLGKIDVGVFVTSINKHQCATRIWPPTNRNGSFQELNSRNFKNQIALPLICIGFAPDDFSDSAPLLGKGGEVYFPKRTGVKDSSGVYEILKDETGSDILKPI